MTPITNCWTRCIRTITKERIAPVLNEYKDRVTSIVDKAQEATRPLFTA